MMSTKSVCYNQNHLFKGVSGLVNIRFIMSNFGQITDNESFNSIAPIESLYPDLTQNAVSNATTDGLNPEPSVSTRIIYWYHPDYVGNVDLVTDLNQEAYEFYLYNPWGESLYHWESGSSSWNSPYRFNSKEFDAETGMHYYGARYHHPKLSVWMSVDPLVEQTMESYIYSGNNAITLLDPDGKWPGLPAMVKHFKYLFHETAKSMAEADYDVIREEAESYASRSWTSEYFTPTRRKIKPNVEVKLAGDGIKDVYFGNEVKGNADLNIEGIKVSGSFYGHLKSAMRYYNVHSIEFDAGSQGTGQASTTSGESGFVVEMIGGKNDDVVFHFVIQDKSIFNQLKALHNSKVNREYDRLVNSDPLVKDYMALRRAYNEYRSYYDKLHNGENEITEIQKKKLEGLKNTYNELVKKFFEKHGS